MRSVLDGGPHLCQTHTGKTLAIIITACKCISFAKKCNEMLLLEGDGTRHRGLEAQEPRHTKSSARIHMQDHYVCFPAIVLLYHVIALIHASSSRLSKSRCRMPIAVQQDGSPSYKPLHSRDSLPLLCVAGWQVAGMSIPSLPSPSDGATHDYLMQ